MSTSLKEDAKEDLFRAFLQLKTEDEVRRFLIDLCTPAEITAFAERLAIARELNAGGKGYREIAADIGASTTTVARVARFLKQEDYGGYKLVLSRTDDKNKK
jgi:TrpR-related protein YerC/YecD